MRLVIFKTLDGEEHHDIDILLEPNPLFDYHTEINWGGVRAISNEFIFSHLKDYEGIFKVPDETCDALIRVAHAVFEAGKLSQKDVEIIKKGNKFIMAEEVNKRGWIDTYMKLMDYIKPGNLPLWLLAYGVWETRAWRKLWGARFILYERLNHLLRI